MSGYFKDLINQSLSRTRETTLSVLGVGDPGLRTHLANQMHNVMGQDDCFLASPVFEHTFGWEPGDITLKDLEGKLLSPAVVSALADSPNENYRFESTVKPYAHQLASWRTLLADEPKSAVITTGTGSGKTECFMIPILQDLAREHKESGGALEGIRALFLYPLNALINSQRERLDAWTKPFGANIRFCLYNGNTKEKSSAVRKEQAKFPNQVLSREELRTRPSPILMTNATMLEYMLVRQVDDPIIQKSREQKSLRWIVLDEAHTYIGSQAAELSLLLRRVVEAFGRNASDIRFIATSATMADNDEKAQERLKDYLASLAGISNSQVVVIGGKRLIPELPFDGEDNGFSFEKLKSIDVSKSVSASRFLALSSSRKAQMIRNKIVGSPKPVSLGDLLANLEPVLEGTSSQEQQQEVLEWLDLLTETKPLESQEPFLKLRAHLFQKVLHGLWSCVNPDCTEKGRDLSGWPFGKVYVQQRGRCECGAPIYEAGFCDECKTPHLTAEHVHPHLKQASPYVSDEFSLQEDESDDVASENSAGRPRKSRLVIAPHSDDVYVVEGAPRVFTSESLDLETGELGCLDATRSITIHHSESSGSHCVTCGNTGNRPAGFLRKAYLGSPFYVSNAVPTVLEFCPDPASKDCDGVSPETLPGRGRKVITFTDSRQGTARMAVRMQQEAERSRLRGLVFQILRNRQAQANVRPKDIPTGSYEEIVQQADQLEKLGMKDAAANVRAKAEAMRKGESFDSRVEVPWSDMVNELAASDDIRYSILDYNKYANPQLFKGDEGGCSMARVLLTREYARRPKNQNSTETLGLIQVGYNGLNSVIRIPEYWAETQAPASDGKGFSALTLDDWKNYLKVALDFFVRENTCMYLGDAERAWMGAHFAPKQLFAPGSEVTGSRTRPWPQIGKGQRHRLIKILALGTGLNPEVESHKNKLNAWLQAAWQDLVRSHILQSQGSGYAMTREILMFSLPKSVWVCPVTNRILDTTFRGLTPYLPNRAEAEKYRCKKIEMPDFTQLAPEGGVEGTLPAIRRRVTENAVIARLRPENLWTDLSDRTAEGGFYYRTAEHSAQQAAQRLEDYEELFKKGKINVLNCSTTMEMGVDIGGVSAVVMNNVPPHPANYLQRAGRAGRRSESRAIAYTICKPDPHNTRAFKNPKWPFETAIPSPVITLNAPPLVQRHVNSFLLALFLKSKTTTDEDRTRLNLLWFFGGQPSVCERFVDWLDTLAAENEEDNTVLEGVRKITVRTALKSSNFSLLAGECKTAIQELAESWIEEYRQLNTRHSQASDDAYKKALELEKKRHEQEYLLKDLAARAFLPGYGFPTDVVNFNTNNVEDFVNRAAHREDKTREDNIFTYKEKPSRGLPIAIREYAPGAQVVIDGRVYRSAGVALHSDYAGSQVTAQKFDIAWLCNDCGANGYREYAYINSDQLCCTQCRATINPASVRRVLRPVGFTTDFYESTNNNVSTQKYIPVEKPRISVDENVISLPDDRCGFVRFGSKGHVFHHSGGENGAGYAVCMQCGLAESMTANGEVPERLQPERFHRPIGGSAGSHKEVDCSGERVMPNIYLGYQAQTDVLELVLRSPLTGEWIPGNDEGRVIATTLAVALRDSIADLLGIASTEMGFGVRPDKDLATGAIRHVIQVYDDVAGGAGFVHAGLDDLAGLIGRMYHKLDCSATCDNVCATCLAGKDSRVEFDELNRKAAQDWLHRSGIRDHLHLPEPFGSIPGASYWPYEPMRFVRHWINKGAKSISIQLNGDAGQWDLGYPDVRRQLMNWHAVDGLLVQVIIPSGSSIPKEIKQELAHLGRFGIVVGEGTNAPRIPDVFLPLQLELNDGKVVTLVTNNSASQSPGKLWLRGDDRSLWISTEQTPAFDCTLIDTSGWTTKPAGAVVAEIFRELNGNVLELSNRFWKLIESKAPEYAQAIKNDTVISLEYEDRYLKSPWTVVLLAGILKALNPVAAGSVTIRTVEGDSYRNGIRSWHNWNKPDDQRLVSSAFIRALLNVAQVTVDLKAEARDLTHRRVLTITLGSGRTIKCAFDQGMGYWELRTSRYGLKGFDFSLSRESQVNQLNELFENGKMENIGGWPTDVSLYEDQAKD